MNGEWMCKEFQGFSGDFRGFQRISRNFKENSRDMQEMQGMGVRIKQVETLARKYSSR